MQILQNFKKNPYLLKEKKTQSNGWFGGSFYFRVKEFM